MLLAVSENYIFPSTLTNSVRAKFLYPNVHTAESQQQLPCKVGIFHTVVIIPIVYHRLHVGSQERVRALVLFAGLRSRSWALFLEPELS